MKTPASRSGEKSRYGPVLIFCAGGVLAALLLVVTHRSHPALIGSAQCELQFQRYESGTWEARWLDEREDLSKRICKTIGKQTDSVATWIKGVRPFLDGTTPVGDALLRDVLADGDTWSRFVYKDSCSGKDVRVPIEPLVGLLRHPHAHQSCRPKDIKWTIDVAHDRPGVGEQHIENKGYMMISPYTPQQVAQVFPGRRYLFDLGTGMYSSGSMPWLLAQYESRGLGFDEIWGWELKELNATDYWNAWPDEQKQRMHFYNEGYDIRTNSPNFPLNILKRIYRPGDFVVVKLDVDTESLERDFMQAIMDMNLVGVINEVFWEQHYIAPEMQRYFRFVSKASWADSIQLYHDFRRAGMRLHYWP